MIYTFGDGFAAGHIWPEWPQFLEIFTDGQVVNHGIVGAGNELIFNTAIKQALDATNDDVFLVQWTYPLRFDKVVESPVWESLQETDVDYANNRYTVFDVEWWPTSNSVLPEIQLYHNFYVQPYQAVDRSLVFMVSLSGFLQNLGIKHYYLLTYDFYFGGSPLIDHITKLPWITAPSMETWSKTSSVSHHERQPLPIAHYKFVEKFLLPVLGIRVDDNILTEIERSVHRINTTPFYYDRKKVWGDFKNEVSVLFK